MFEEDGILYATFFVPYKSKKIIFDRSMTQVGVDMI